MLIVSGTVQIKPDMRDLEDPNTFFIFEQVASGTTVKRYDVSKVSDI